ncbi:Alpha/Beta hydrolase protein [Xylariales sp. PMI_506]|nr:Alpha/Beta hydrolase protein [Xylariales sp. PMI_506]
MENLLQQKELKTSRSLTYTYYVTKHDENKSSQSPEITLLLLHGWPATSELWLPVLPFLSQLPCRIIVPDLLGSGGTSKPTDPEEYNVKFMVQDLCEILDAEGVDKFIPIGHDFGSWLAQRVYLINAPRCKGLVTLSVAYMPPILADVDFSLDFFLSVTEQQAGYARYDYFRFFVADDCPEIMEQHAESLYHLIHGDSPTTIRDYYCEKDAFRRYLVEDRREPVKEHARAPGELEKFASRVRRDGMTGPQCWYRSMVDAVQYRAEKELFKPEDLVINAPVLFIGCAQDAVATTAAVEEPAKLGLLPDLTKYELDCSHYCTLERPAEIGNYIVDFLTNKKLL